MKQIVAIIRNELYYKTKDALQVAGFGSMSVEDVIGRGRRNGQRELAKKTDNDQDKEIYMSDMYAKKMLEIYTRDEDVDKVIQVILDNNRQGNLGDGKIFVLPVRGSLRIRTGETGNEALL